ncbi:TPA: hypothetical protein NJ353_003281 [Vibrio parahaemolyticus]|uniref:Uncharacterized protein n=1 Tax=Vibrio parahaemolyticus TaxID=670 RepID=A0A7M1VS04_VIBPH|nr:hypothetical protein VP46_00038 [Vibrio parahaemolyticus]QOS24416.1 hypothetical protein VP47_00038 [Vibrio parahaemolyticus]HCE1501072.1 hypothetical protein [Vibrio parahaemolyticus]HCG7082828.1 hypothetical protein [Vibrio parahaemolyticus]HCH0724217.1 hypothetical protein [Vibrio parahaemolyticus]
MSTNYIIDVIGSLNIESITQQLTKHGINVVSEASQNNKTKRLVFFCPLEVFLLGKEPNATLAEQIDSWTEQTQALFNQVMAGSDSAVLIDLGYAISDLDGFNQSVTDLFSLDTPFKSTLDINWFALLQHSLSVQEYFQAQSVYENLLASADIIQNIDRCSIINRALSYISQLRASTEKGNQQQALLEEEVQNLASSILNLETQTSDLTTENKELTESKSSLENEKQELASESELSLLQIHQLQEELEALQQTSQVKESSILTLEARTSELTATNTKLTEDKNLLESEKQTLVVENELSLLQIHQLQEELEHYYYKSQTRQMARKVSFPQAEQITTGYSEFSLQLRKLL